MPDFRGYGELVYSLPVRFPQILHSNLVLASIGRTLAKVEGQVTFRQDVVLDVWELVDFEAGRLLNYSYEVYVGGEKRRWYDPFEHPEAAELASTFPHHMHLPPDIKRNRVPAPGISFEEPNLPGLIERIRQEFLQTESA